METTTHSLGRRWNAVREELRGTRATRSARKSLKRELASYSSPGELNDLDAILYRHSEEETADIRRILATHRRA
jgi:hypothetical protein